MHNAEATPLGGVVVDLGCNAIDSWSLDNPTLEWLFILPIFPMWVPAPLQIYGWKLIQPFNIYCCSSWFGYRSADASEKKGVSINAQFRQREIKPDSSSQALDPIKVIVELHLLAPFFNLRDASYP